MQTGTYISLALYFVLMIAIGLWAWKRSTDTSEGYLLAGRNLPPAVAALSAGASDMSGWLLLGLPGALYASGLVEAWIGIGLFIGALANWFVVAPRLRAQTESYGNALTIPEFLANRFPDKAVALRVISALIVVVFFAVYTAAGLVGGGKLFETSFAGLFGGIGMSDYMVGIWITALVVLAYTMVGGFLAVSLTDFVQGLIMVVALAVMPLVVMFGEGGSAGGSLTDVPVEGFLSLTQGLTLLGFISAVTWGLGYFGQPHIIVRFMAIDTVEKVRPARNIGMTWMGVALLGSIGIGIAGRAFTERNGIVVDDPETIFIVLANLLFRRHASERESVNVGRICVALVAIAAIVIASNPDSEVLGLVSNAWAGFGAAFGPLIILALTWNRMTGAGAVAGLVTGAAVVVAWIALGWNAALPGMDQGLYEIVPGFIAAWLAIWLVSKATAGTAERPLPA